MNAPQRARLASNADMLATLRDEIRLIQMQERSVLDALHRITTDAARLLHTKETIDHLDAAGAAIDVAVDCIALTLAGNPATA